MQIRGVGLCYKSREAQCRYMCVGQQIRLLSIVKLLKATVIRLMHRITQLMSSDFVAFVLWLL